MQEPPEICDSGRDYRDFTRSVTTLLRFFASEIFSILLLREIVIVT
jgi:hypothetical protein